MIVVELANEFVKADNELLAEECKLLWALVHEFARATRNTAEHNHPALFLQYEALCDEFGETAVQATMLGDGMP
jgi:hypothetical protein